MAGINSIGFRPERRQFGPMKFAICNETFQGWKLEDSFRFARQAGYDALEIAPFTIAPTVRDISIARRRDIRDMAQRNDMAVSAIHWVLAHTEGFHQIGRAHV